MRYKSGPFIADVLWLSLLFAIVSAQKQKAEAPPEVLTAIQNTDATEWNQAEALAEVEDDVLRWLNRVEAEEQSLFDAIDNYIPSGYGKGIKNPAMITIAYEIGRAHV